MASAMPVATVAIARTSRLFSGPTKNMASTASAGQRRMARSGFTVAPGSAQDRVEGRGGEQHGAEDERGHVGREPARLHAPDAVADYSGEAGGPVDERLDDDPALEEPAQLGDALLHAPDEPEVEPVHVPELVPRGPEPAQLGGQGVGARSRARVRLPGEDQPERGDGEGDEGDGDVHLRGSAD